MKLTKKLNGSRKLSGFVVNIKITELKEAQIDPEDEVEKIIQKGMIIIKKIEEVK